MLLVSTRNWRIALLGLANLGCITATFLGLLVALTPQGLNSNQGVFLILVVGLSVDFSAHLLHACALLLLRPPRRPAGTTRSRASPGRSGPGRRSGRWASRC